MVRKVAALALLAIAPFVFARTRAAGSGGGTADNAEFRATASSVSGLVTAVNGNVITLAGGLVTIDATGAKVNGGTVEPGAMLFATVNNDNGTLRATNVVVTRIPDATISGTVDSVDVTNKTLTVLGRTIHVTNDTSFGGMHHRDTALGLGDILPNQLVAVQTENENNRLVARTVLVLAPIAPTVHVLRGTVKSIGNQEWVIERAGGATVTVGIDAQTKITGTPKVGDTVEVLYRVDSANANIAIAIVRFAAPQLPTVPTFARITGTVKSIGAREWLVDNTKVLINERTKLEPGIQIGDAVEGVGEKHTDGSVTAVFLMKRRH